MHIRHQGIDTGGERFTGGWIQQRAVVANAQFYTLVGITLPPELDWPSV
ncbi:hypothetical protein [Microbulbifer agarilyticus]|nr:hypothetical protein [Microbulbifer agarilyticus]